MTIETNDYEEFLKQFKLLNIIAAEFRNVCTVIGTELDCTLVRTNLIMLQRYMMYVLHNTECQLIKCWRNTNIGLSTNITSEQSDQLFSIFTTYIEYHMRALLKTLHLITLFPSMNLQGNMNTTHLNKISSNDNVDNKEEDKEEGEEGKKFEKDELNNNEVVIQNDSSWILASNKLLQTNINSLINTGLTKSIELGIDQNQISLLLANKTNLDNNNGDDNEQSVMGNSNLSEIDILKNEYCTLQTALHDISSLVCVTPWNILAFPIDTEQRLSLQESTSTIHPRKSQLSNRLQTSNKKYTLSSINSSNFSTTFGQNQLSRLWDESSLC
ncbi:hypothetical protein Smp_134930 [Schistosoma mansoni]|uniref:hypothetical protein n=1 Tax=Schistosoma mansoni TaxID=6183 RepID=UPI00022DC422|nr:hypothetical protein Smp_134930 [Schistosoma mansoni]|eukprot:XP_018651401.1 hypothetical protein Smp_134930 [Schistosoma mansoni]